MSNPARMVKFASSDLLASGDCWSEDGDVLYLDRLEFTRGQAKRLYVDRTDAWFPDVRCRRVWMRQAVEPHPEWGYEWFQECAKADSDFQCWRVQS